MDAVHRDDTERIEEDLREELIDRRAVELAVSGESRDQGRSKIKQRGLQLRGTGLNRGDDGRCAISASARGRAAGTPQHYQNLRMP
jgi:hypothetical protein